METLINLYNLSFTPTGLMFYWAPVIICLIGFFLECIELYKIDVKNSIGKYYTPELTIGSILGRLFVCPLPIVNVFVAIFRFGINWFINLFDFLDKTLNFALVRSRYKPSSDEN